MTVPILLTPTEAAIALGIGRSKLYELMQAGVLESVRIGSCRRIPADALSDLVDRLRVHSGSWPSPAGPGREAGTDHAEAI
jgi:excisionase family DNA binding protein